MRKQNTPSPIVRGRMTASTDSGQVTAYRPAQHTKPQGLIQRFANLVARFRKPLNPGKTTEQGSAGSTSPTTYQQSLWAQRYERWAYISDCRELILNDPRARKATRMFAAEATRGGVQIRVQGEDRLSKRAQDIANDLIKYHLQPQKLCSWGWMVHVEGDLFVQMVLEGDRLVKLVRMPAASMERLSDDADQIIDPLKAFAQVDTTTSQQIADFPEALMCHVRWDHVDGDRYGTPEIISVRRSFNLLNIVEATQTTRRQARASISRLWSIGDPENPGDEPAINKFKADNGFVEGEREVFNPMEVARDFFGNGLTSCEVLQGDGNVHEIDDIKYFQDVATSGLPTPRVLYNLGAEDINRDVLDEVYAQWLKDTSRVTEALDEAVRAAFDLSLMLAGIDPALVEYETIWSSTSPEKQAERIDAILKIRQARLMSQKTALSMLQEYTLVPDLDAEAKELEGEQQAEMARDIEHQSALAESSAEPQKGKPAKPAKKAKADEFTHTN